MSVGGAVAAAPRVPGSAPVPARVEGVRLGGDLDGATVEAVRAAPDEHEAVFFRDQRDLTEDGQYAFARLLGAPTTPHVVRRR